MGLGARRERCRSSRRRCARRWFPPLRLCSSGLLTSMRRRQADGLAASGLHVMTNANALLPASVSNLGRSKRYPVSRALARTALCRHDRPCAFGVSAAPRSRDGNAPSAGMTPRRERGMVATQALTIVSVTVAISVPAGAGARRTPLESDHEPRSRRRARGGARMSTRRVRPCSRHCHGCAGRISDVAYVPPAGK